MPNDDEIYHYASKYYDPIKAHEYYMQRRVLKGRASGVKNSTLSSSSLRNPISENKRTVTEAQRDEMKARAEELRKEIAHIYRVEFRGTNFTEFARIMQERGYDLSRSTIYNILRENRIRSPQRKRVKKKKTTTKNNETAKKKTTTTNTDSKLTENKKVSEKELVNAKK